MKDGFPLQKALSHAQAASTDALKVGLADAEATSQFAQRTADWALQHPNVRLWFLTGPLGAGKSSFTRALLRQLGVQGAIKSPTYTLVEPYELSIGAVLHLDLYRLAAASELEFLGLREQLEEARLVLIEWPERAIAALPAPHVWLHFDYAEPGRSVRIESTVESIQGLASVSG